METYFDCYGKPLQTLTGKIWNKLFEEKKAGSSSHKSFQIIYEQVLCMTNPIINKYGDISKDFDEYADYLYSVIATLIDGKIDYCYHLHNILLLLSVFGDALESRYMSKYKCFEVWLNESKFG